MKRLLITRRVLALTGVALTTFACGAGSHDVVTNRPLAGASGSTTTVQIAPLTQPITENPTASVDLAPPYGINELVNKSDAGIVAQIESVSTPFWNSPNGAVWEEDPNNPDPNKAEPLELRLVTARVDGLIFGTSALSPAVGTSVTITVYGTGESSGAKLNGNTPDRFNQLDGPFVPGSEMLLLLQATSIPYSDGTRSGLALTQYRQAQWAINGQTAVSAVAGRSVAYADLLSRILAERQRGPVPASPSDNTTINPLGS